jgi:hypothetical protein
MINDELAQTTPSFESCCVEIAALQRLAKVKTGQTQQPKQKRCHCPTSLLVVVVVAVETLTQKCAVTVVILTSAVNARS